MLGCGGCGRQPVPDETATWVTEPEFRIGDALEGDALFSWIPYLRATEDGRIFILEPNISAVSVWDRDGEPVLSIGRPGQGPGDFVFPRRVHVGPDGFFVREASRFTFYADDGTLMRTAPGILTSASFQGWSLRTLGCADRGCVSVGGGGWGVTGLDERLAASDDGRLAEAGERRGESAPEVEADIYQVRNRSNQDPLNFPIKVNKSVGQFAVDVGAGRRASWEADSSTLGCDWDGPVPAGREPRGAAERWRWPISPTPTI